MRQQKYPMWACNDSLVVHHVLAVHVVLAMLAGHGGLRRGRLLAATAKPQCRREEKRGEQCALHASAFPTRAGRCQFQRLRQSRAVPAAIGREAVAARGPGALRLPLATAADRG